jgi:hypothetical protein
MTDKQWDALERMTRSKYNNNFFSATLSVGEVTLTKIKTRVKSFPIYRLEYPTHSVTLKKDKSVNGTDLHYLRTLYNEYLSSMSI